MIHHSTISWIDDLLSDLSHTPHENPNPKVLKQERSLYPCTLGRHGAEAGKVWKHDMNKLATTLTYSLRRRHTQPLTGSFELASEDRHTTPLNSFEE